MFCGVPSQNSQIRFLRFRNNYKCSLPGFEKEEVHHGCKEIKGKVSLQTLQKGKNPAKGAAQGGSFAFPLPFIEADGCAVRAVWQHKDREIRGSRHVCRLQVHTDACRASW